MDSVPRSVSQRLCSNCEHGALAQGGVFCMEFREMIDDERTARECPCWDAIYADPSVHPSVPLHVVSEPARVDEIKRDNTTARPAHERVRPAPAPPADMKSNNTSAQTAPERPGEHEVLVQACMAYLAGLHISDWGQHWSVYSDDGRRMAADWLATTVEAVAEAHRKESPCLNAVRGSGGTAASATTPTRPPST